MGTTADAMKALLTPKEPEGQPEAEPVLDEQVETPEPEEVEEEIEVPEEVAPVVEGEDVAEIEEPEGQPDITYDVGEGEQVTVDELRLGYMKDRDYRQKTAALAEQRTADAATREAFQEKLEQAELVAQLDQEDLQSAENVELKDYDPAAYYEKRERVEAKQRKLVELRAERDAQEERAYQAQITEEQGLLTSAIPEWMDEGVMVDEIKACQEMWGRVGLTESEMANLTSHKYIVISRKAALYDRLMAAKPQDKKVNTKPKTATPGTTTSKGDKVTQNRKAARERHKTSGKPADAVRLLLEK